MKKFFSKKFFAIFSFAIFLFCCSNIFATKTFALVPIAKTINIPKTRILDKNKISLNEAPIGGSWYFDENTRNWYFLHIDMYGTVDFLKSGCYKIYSLGETYYYMFDETGAMLTGLIRYNGGTYYFQETGLNRGSLYVGRIDLNGITYEFGKNGKMYRAMDKAMKTPVIK